jgi:hypothetical protein
MFWVDLPKLETRFSWRPTCRRTESHALVNDKTMACLVVCNPAHEALPAPAVEHGEEEGGVQLGC